MREPLIVPPNPRKPRRGVVAMIDALAFKGIWDRHGYEPVLRRLEHIQEIAEAEAAHLRSNYPKLASVIGHELIVRFLSDTIVIAAHAKNHLKSTIGFRAEGLTPDAMQEIGEDATRLDRATEFIALKAVVEVVATALAGGWTGASRGELPPLNYRGAIAYGDFVVNQNYLLGQAVDDCGECYEAPEAAIVMFHPKAAAFWEECQEIREELKPRIFRTGEVTVQDLKSYMRLPEAVRYRVPLKEGTVVTYAVNPFSRLRREEWGSASEIMLGLMATAASAPSRVRNSVRRKRENTEEFFRFVSENAPAPFPPQPPDVDEAFRILYPSE